MCICYHNVTSTQVHTPFSLSSPISNSLFLFAISLIQFLFPFSIFHHIFFLFLSVFFTLCPCSCAICTFSSLSHCFAFSPCLLISVPLSSYPMLDLPEPPAAWWEWDPIILAIGPHSPHLISFLVLCLYLVGLHSPHLIPFLVLCLYLVVPHSSLNFLSTSMSIPSCATFFT